MNAAVVGSVGRALMVAAGFLLGSRRGAARKVEVVALHAEWQEKSGRSIPQDIRPRGAAARYEFRLHLTMTLRNTAAYPQRIRGVRIGCPASALLLLYDLPRVPGAPEAGFEHVRAGQQGESDVVTLPHPREERTFDLRVDLSRELPADSVVRVPMVLELPTFVLRRDYGPYPLSVLSVNAEVGRGVLPLGSVLLAPAGPMLDGALENEAEEILRQEMRRALAGESRPGEASVLREFSDSLNRRVFDWVAQRRRTVEKTLAELSEFGPFHEVAGQHLTGRADQLDEYVEQIDKRQTELRSRLSEPAG